MKRLDWHIGLQKTGTSSIQMQLMRPDGPLTAAGIDYLPGQIGPGPAHHNAAWDAGRHKRHQPDLPGIAALLEAARSSPLDRILISSEEFSLMAPDRVAALAGLTGGCEVYPHLVLRNALDWAESLYAQAAKRGDPGDFAGFANRLSRGGRLRFDRIADSWSALGPLQVMVYEAHDDICAAFARSLGAAAPPPGPRRNRSLNERFVALSLDLRARCRSGQLTVAGRPLPAHAEPRLAKTLLQIGARHSRFAGSPVFLDPDAAQVFLESEAETCDRLAAHVDLPACYRSPDPARRLPEAVQPGDREVVMADLAGHETLFEGISP